MRTDALDHDALLELDPQFGFAHGWRMAEATKAEFAWDGGCASVATTSCRSRVCSPRPPRCA